MAEVIDSTDASAMAATVMDSSDAAEVASAAASVETLDDQGCSGHFVKCW